MLLQLQVLQAEHQRALVELARLRLTDSAKLQQEIQRLGEQSARLAEDKARLQEENQRLQEENQQVNEENQRVKSERQRLKENVSTYEGIDQQLRQEVRMRLEWS